MSFSTPRFAHVYCLYGLRLRSAWRFPDLAETESGTADVELFEGPASLFSAVSCRAAIEPTQWFHHDRLQDGSDYLRWSGLFEFLISADGRRIACHPHSETSLEAFYTYLLGQVISFALLRQGLEPLHSTAVVIDGNAIAFLGDTGYGKSSLGAAFLRAGHQLLTDDLLVVRSEGQRFCVYPGPSRIKLFPEVARSVLGESDSGVPMNGLTSKLIIPLNGNHSSTRAAPLKAIYVLMPPARGRHNKRATIRRLSQRKAFLAIVKNTFNTRITEPLRLERQFRQATALASKVPVKSLSYPRTLKSLPTVRQAVLSDLMRDR